ncbi:MAG: DUF4317 domain-containing protein [Clostridia bacterium]|nr:DUF4317 domain-containing protein [Clostridia bacterium]
MTEKELREIKRRFRPEKSNIPRIVGCFVNGNREIISKITQPLLSGESAVTEKLLSAMKKVLSGSLGTNLCDIEFSTKQVTDSPEHKLLMRLRDSALSDEAALSEFYTKITESVSIEGNYVILIANDIYDVFSRKNEGEEADSSERFSYIIAAVCPVKTPPEALSFRESDSLFHIASTAALLSPAEVGFMFPAFDDRKTNIYSALLYKRSISEPYSELCEALFGKSAPMPPKAQKETFNSTLAESLGSELSFELIKSVHAQFTEIAEQHKESRSPELLTVTKATVREVLSNCGVDSEKLEKITSSMDESFGVNAPLSPKNIVDLKKFNVSTPEVTVKVPAEHRDLVSTQIIDGVKYIMIRADGGVLVNGIAISDAE